MTRFTAILSGVLLLGGTVAQAADKPAAAAAPPAAAAAPATPPAPVPSPEVDALFKPYEGSWKCDTTFAAGAMGPGSPEMKMKSEVKIKKEAGGFWYKGDFKMKKSKMMPAMEATFLLGYDEATKAAVNVNYDSMGSFAIEHAPGATADKITFAGDGHMMGMKTKIRETMAKTDPKTVEHTFEVDMGKGFQPMGSDICKK